MTSTTDSEHTPKWLQLVSAIVLILFIVGVGTGFLFTLYVIFGSRVSPEQLARLGGIAYLLEFLKKGDPENIEAIKAMAPKGWEAALNGGSSVAAASTMAILAAVAAIAGPWIMD